jgi:3-hydroxyacyl-CoA dehydrogenase
MQEDEKMKSDALAYLLSAENEVSEAPMVSGGVQLIEIKKAAVIGAGTMGTGIAMTYVNAGIPVLLKEISLECLNRGLASIRHSYENSLKKRRMTRETMDRCIGLITPVLSYDGFSEADIALEAAYEDLDLKKKIFAELSLVCRPEAILATNTSTLDIDRIASHTSNPSMVVGHHFFAPANIMGLLEIVRGRWTAHNVIASSLVLAKRLKKTGVVVGNCPGFAGNRMYHKYQREAQFLIEEGAQVPEVDEALRKFGMAMGPFAVRDLSGLDVAWRIHSESRKMTSDSLRQPLVMARLCEMGRFGQKTGAGWYRYRPGSRTPLPDPEVQQIIEDCAREAGIRRRTISSAEIVERTVYALINEGAKILEEGIVQRAMALDVILVAGYGFPRSKGGPMWYADHCGLKGIYERICEFASALGSQWTPAPLLRRLAEEGRCFADFDQR